MDCCIVEVPTQDYLLFYCTQIMFWLFTVRTAIHFFWFYYSKDILSFTFSLHFSSRFYYFAWSLALIGPNFPGSYANSIASDLLLPSHRIQAHFTLAQPLILMEPLVRIFNFLSSRYIPESFNLGVIFFCHTGFQGKNIRLPQWDISASLCIMTTILMASTYA